VTDRTPPDAARMRYNPPIRRFLRNAVRNVLVVVAFVASYQFAGEQTSTCLYRYGIASAVNGRFRLHAVSLEVLLTATSILCIVVPMAFAFLQTLVGALALRLTLPSRRANIHRALRASDGSSGDLSAILLWASLFLGHALGNDGAFVVLILVGLTLSAVLPAHVYCLRLRIRARKIVPRCRNCSYDLTANTSGICPECGQRADRPSAF